MDDLMRDRESCEPTTVLDPLRPTVVRRRVVVDVAAFKRGKRESAPSVAVAGDDDDAPPSSIVAPEAYGALGEADEPGEERSDEVEAEERVEAQREDDDELLVDPRPAVEVGPTIAVGTIAKRLGLPSGQVAAELVSRGFFEVTPATVLSRETARVVVDVFGRAVAEVSEPEPVKVRGKRTPRRAAPKRRTPKTKSKKGTGRSTRRASSRNIQG